MNNIFLTRSLYFLLISIFIISSCGDPIMTVKIPALKKYYNSEGILKEIYYDVSWSSNPYKLVRIQVNTDKNDKNYTYFLNDLKKILKAPRVYKDDLKRCWKYYDDISSGYISKVIDHEPLIIKYANCLHTPYDRRIITGIPTTLQEYIWTGRVFKSAKQVSLVHSVKEKDFFYVKIVTSLPGQYKVRSTITGETVFELNYCRSIIGIDETGKSPLIFISSDDCPDIVINTHRKLIINLLKKHKLSFFVLSEKE